MSADNRSVATDALATLGTIIDDTAGRDAIHLAVEPVVAGQKLYPGQRITLAANEAVPAADAGLGIVDPFIGHPVEPGERFWLIVHPRTITSLRHVWEHPAFGEAGAAIKDEKAVSEQWLRDFINRSDCPSYEEVIGKAVAYAKGDAGWDDDYLHFDGVDAHGEIDPEFWRHFEVVTGIKVEKGASYFSCAC